MTRIVLGEQRKKLRDAKDKVRRRQIRLDEAVAIIADIIERIERIEKRLGIED